MNQQKIIQAGKISEQAKDYAREIVKKGVPLLEIAEKIEGKILELGGKLAFPVNLSIDEIAAHYTPSHDDKSLAHGLLKIDLGVHIDGEIADTAFSMDLENNEENKKLIEASKKALEKAQKTIASGIAANEIGKKISETIENFGFSSVINLSGHQIETYELHAGVSIPNFDDKKKIILDEGLYAIEPFATNGNGKIHEGKPSGIYLLIDNKKPRSQTAREILNFIQEKYKTLPFCSRWLVKEFGIKALFALRQLEENNNLHQFSQLVEKEGAKVSQTENTILVNKNENIVTSEEVN
jgi:methionyl aminopeptidase